MQPSVVRVRSIDFSLSIINCKLCKVYNRTKMNLWTDTNNTTCMSVTYDCQNNKWTTKIVQKFDIKADALIHTYLFRVELSKINRKIEVADKNLFCSEKQYFFLLYSDRRKRTLFYDKSKIFSEHGYTAE